MRTRKKILEMANGFSGHWEEDHSKLGALLLEVALDLRDQLATVIERLGGDGSPVVDTANERDCGKCDGTGKRGYGPCGRCDGTGREAR